METITLQYDATNPALKGLISALLKLDGISKAKTTKKKSGIDEAIDDFKNGRTTKCKDFNEYLEKINS
ncbi:MAG: hypothetical protein K6A94_04870 [Bacteroidales bacterium]|nr:hypothetical protein [Bacteroidales bacterium]